MTPLELHSYKSWDEGLVHIAARIVGYGVHFHPICRPPWEPQVLGDVTDSYPTCLWCIANTVRA